MYNKKIKMLELSLIMIPTLAAYCIDGNTKSEVASISSAESITESENANINVRESEAAQSLVDEESQPIDQEKKILIAYFSFILCERGYI